MALNWWTFGAMLSLASMLVVCSIACYISTGAPSLLTWTGRGRLFSVLTLSLAFMSFGYCQLMFDMNMPLAVATGVVVSKRSGKHSSYEIRNDAGKRIEVPPFGASPPMDGQIARITYVEATGEIVSVELRDRNGDFSNPAYKKSRKRPNLWMWTGLLLLIVGRKPFTVEDLLMSMRSRGTIGDTFGRTRSQEEDMKWHFVGDRLVSKEEYLEQARHKVSGDE